MSINLKNIKTYTDGKATFLVGLLEQIGLSQVIDTHMSNDFGRPPEIPYSILAQMMLVNLCDDHHPLSRLNEYYKYKDIESIFNYSMTLTQINDDRFGGFLDLFYDAGPRQIFSQIAANAFIRYGIKVQTINFDTTSKVMWGTYEVDGEDSGVIQIDYGYSKQKRHDKKQLKVSLGAASGILVDAKVLSGNMDDKTYNKEQLDDVEDLLELLKINPDTFYYIADSALFSLENLHKANNRNINLITRIPDNTKATKSLIEKACANFKNMTPIEPNNKKTARYTIMEATGDYNKVPLKYCICYSEELRKKKEKSISKQVLCESDLLNKLTKQYSKRTFACITDAEIEIKKTLSQIQKKIKYHSLSIDTQEISKRKPGRPSKQSTGDALELCYLIQMNSQIDNERLEKTLLSQSMFVLCSNDLEISGENIFREYKTQGQVEKKFQQLKSPQLVNSLYLNSPKRIEALMYLLLIAVMVLSVAEYVVRREMEKNQQVIVGPGKVKMTRPSLVAIYQIFHNIQTIAYHAGAQTQRDFTHPLNNSIKVILKCLGIPENIFIRGSTYF